MEIRRWNNRCNLTDGMSVGEMWSVLSESYGLETSSVTTFSGLSS